MRCTKTMVKDCPLLLGNLSKGKTMVGIPFLTQEVTPTDAFSQVMLNSRLQVTLTYDPNDQVDVEGQTTMKHSSSTHQLLADVHGLRLRPDHTVSGTLSLKLSDAQEPFPQAVLSLWQLSNRVVSMQAKRLGASHVTHEAKEVDE